METKHMTELSFQYNARKLIGGFTNEAYLLPGNVVIKCFGSKRLSRSSIARHAAECWALERVNLSPTLKGVGSGALYMSFIDGERNLDDFLADVPEAIQQQVFFKAGETLLRIHKEVCLPARDYHARHRKRLRKLIFKAFFILCGLRINPLEVHRYLVNSYDEEEVQRRGLVLIHGDYWLNNIVGRIYGRRFEITGVIDWEFSGLGSPYEDFALVYLSMERTHGDVAESFWRGHKSYPDRTLQRHFSLIKIIDWLASDEDKVFSSHFYQDKLRLLRQII